MGDLLADIGVVLLLIIVAALLNTAEIAVISLRESQVRRLAQTRGARGRRLARLVSDPSRLLTAVRIGVGAMTLLAAGYGAVTISGRLSQALRELSWSTWVADLLALLVVTAVISFLALVIGELTPRRLAGHRRESVALLASGPLSGLATILRPVVYLLEASTNVLVWLLGGDPKDTGEEISAEELQSLVAANESLTTVERRMIADVFTADDTHVREVMVPRPEVDFLQASLSVSRAARQALAHPHSRFPVIGRDADEIVGVVHLRELLHPSHPLGRAATVGDLAAPVSVIPGTKGVLDALQEMRGAGQHLAVVLDEYGGTDGIVTLEDLVEEIVGEMLPGAQDPHPEPVRVGEVDGLLNLDDFAEATGLVLPPGPYDTVAGYLMAELGRLPEVGDVVEVAGRALTVMELDGRRVSRIAVAPLAYPMAAVDGAEPTAEGGPADPDRVEG